MTSQKRKPANAKPITSNPLFPAVVALWFGALFGLGSLAVRPSLLEGLVLQSHIDLIIPAAAPPLGITARILLALVMAALGAVLGIALARRLARPKVEHYERKRGAKDLAAEQPRVRSRDAHPDAPARRPISAHEEFGTERSLDDHRPVASGPGALANRRRALAIIDHEPEFVPQDFAPLPGVATVQPLDLAELALPAEPIAEPVVSPVQASVNPVSTLDWANAAPIVPIAEPDPISPEAAHRDGRQVFGMIPPEAPAAEARQIFGVVAEDDHLPQDFVKAAGFQTSVFDTPEPSPLFARAVEAPVAAPVAEPAPEFAPTEPLPSPSSLGITDLAARLADSMRRRRERAQAQPAIATEPPAPAYVPEAPVSELPAMSAAFTIPITFAAPEAPAAETAADEPAPTPVLAQFTSAPIVPAPNPASPPKLPAAMRPLALDAFLEDDTVFDDPSLLPPRHIAMPAPAQQPAAFAVPNEVTAITNDECEPAGEASLADAEVDNPYASLLAVAPVRQSFVRIDEPEADASETIEPVVIFPGQAAQIVQLGAVAAAPADDTEFRRFDAPASAGQGQPVAAGNPAAAINPDQTAQALRAALSNLQRMSGAA